MKLCYNYASRLTTTDPCSGWKTGNKPKLNYCSCNSSLFNWIENFSEGKPNPCAIWCSSPLFIKLNGGYETHSTLQGKSFFSPHSWKRAKTLTILYSFCFVLFFIILYSYPVKIFSEEKIQLNFKKYFMRCCIKYLVLTMGLCSHFVTRWLIHSGTFRSLWVEILYCSRHSTWPQRWGCENFIYRKISLLNGRLISFLYFERTYLFLTPCK